MKKFLTLSVAAVLAVGTLGAQTTGPWGIRAGLNVTDMVFKDGGAKVTPGTRAGYHVGASYRWDMPVSLPFALETGLMLTSKGARNSEAGVKATYKMLYLELPLTVSYRFDIRNVVSIKPFFGFYYDLGLSGRLKVKEGGKKESVDIFSGEYQMLKRSDFGLKFGAEVGWRAYSLGLAYEPSLMNIGKDSGTLKVRNHCFMITLGYNF